MLKVLFEVESSINGKLTVVDDPVWGIHILGKGLTQSGGVAEKVWCEALLEVRNQELEIGNVLILGLGGGSIAKLVRELWGNKPIITGIDIDPVIVELGKKYMNLDGQDVQIIIDDADKVFRQDPKNAATIDRKADETPVDLLDTIFTIQDMKYDLVCVDMYVGDSVPGRFQTEKFVRRTRSVLVRGGGVIFNRLYGEKDRKIAEEFGNILEKVFQKVKRVYCEGNVLFVCS